MNRIVVENLGRRDYRWTWNYQRSLFEKRCANNIPDTLLIVEHDPVYTIGRTGAESNIRCGKASLEQFGLPVVHVDRGGDVTFHGPGQLVGYPVLRLEDYYRDVHRYLRDLEEVIIRTLAGFDIPAGRKEGLTGVWVNGKKIAAIGVKVSRWVTMHGFALNIVNDLSYFEKIYPCGIRNINITSMSRCLNKSVRFDDVVSGLTGHFRDVFIPSEQPVQA